jgi:hypothetical protein
MRRYVSAFILSLALGGPVAAVAAEDQPHRYYDRDYKQYHDWNDHEERAYRHWLQERHKAYRSFDRSSRSEQRNYWRWRHSHPGDDGRM